MTIRGIIFVQPVAPGPVYSGEELDVLQTLSTGGVRLAGVLVARDVSEAVNALATSGLPPELAATVTLLETTGISMRSMVEELRLDGDCVLCVAQGSLDLAMRQACRGAGLPILTLPVSPSSTNSPAAAEAVHRWSRVAEDALRAGPLGGRLGFLLQAVAQSQGHMKKGSDVQASSLSPPQQVARPVGQTPGRRRAVDTPVLVVGAAMSVSRYHKLAARGLLPLVAKHNVCFQQLLVGAPLQAQGSFHAILAKATDFLEDSNTGQPPIFAPAIVALEEEATKQCGIPFINSLHLIQKVLDRKALADCLAAVTAAASRDAVTLLAPTSLLVDSLASSPDLEARIRKAGLTWPLIVKPQVACGLPQAHTMAIAFNSRGLAESSVPTPGLLQRYIDHAGRVHKVYVMGSKVHVVERRSLPDLSAWAAGVGRGLRPGLESCNVLHFDSRHEAPSCLPVPSDPTSSLVMPTSSKGRDLDLKTLNKAVELLRHQLQLTLFGFDILVESITGTHFIVDVNFFPSFSGFPDAPVALAEALRLAVDGLHI